MNFLVICPDCAAPHREPVEAHLGIAIRCADCLLLLEIDAFFYESAVDEAA